MAAGEVRFNGTASSAIENAEYVPFSVTRRQTASSRTNLIAVQAHNSSVNSSTDFYFDLRLTAQRDLQPRARAGRAELRSCDQAPPQVRQVIRAPVTGVRPPRGYPAKVADPDGVASVLLQYQVVDPGNYIAITDAAFQTNWMSLPMHETGSEAAYTVELPGYLAEAPAVGALSPYRHGYRGTVDHGTFYR